MTKRPDEWMPLHIGSYMADTMHLTRDQHGGYFLIIMAYWRKGSALADDDGQLAAIVKASPSDWKKLRVALAPFFKVADGVWWHKRIEAELEVAIAKRDERSKSGSEGAKKRWQNRGNKDGETIAEPLAKPLANAWQNDAPLPTSSLRSEVTSADALGADAPQIRDPVKEMWGRGALLVGNKNRSMLGKMAKQYGPVVLMEAIIETEAEHAIEPLEFLIGCCKRRQGNGRSAGHQGALDILAQAAIDHDERQSYRGDPEAADRPAWGAEELDDGGPPVH